MIWRVILVWLLAVLQIRADIPRNSSTASVFSCKNCFR